MEGYVLELSPEKKAKASEVQYFDMSFQTENENITAVCFSPEKWGRLDKFKKETTSCVITKLNKSNNNSNFCFTNFTTIKQKTLSFKKTENKSITSTIGINRLMDIYQIWKPKL